MNTKTLKEHLKYKIPEIKLAIIREPSTEPTAAIRTPSDIELYLEPMKHLSDYVTKLDMCRISLPIPLLHSETRQQDT